MGAMIICAEALLLIHLQLVEAVEQVPLVQLELTHKLDPVELVLHPVFQQPLQFIVVEEEAVVHPLQLLELLDLVVAELVDQAAMEQQEL